MSAKNETQKDDNQKVETVPFLSLFRYATFADKLLITLGTIGAMGNGLAFPYFGIRRYFNKLF
jgi:ATP-binding cassette subfamily B (MDR/TAP) protein 1